MEEWIIKIKDEFQQTIPDEERMLVQAFEDYIRFAIKSIKESDNTMIAKDMVALENALNFLTQKIIQADLNTKKQILLKDEKMDYLQNLSYQAYHLAMDVLQGRDIEVFFDIPERMKELQNLENEVKEYNKPYAKQLISEAILDLNYIQDPSSKAYSLRLGREMQSILTKNEEKQ